MDSARVHRRGGMTRCADAARCAKEGATADVVHSPGDVRLVAGLPGSDLAIVSAFEIVVMVPVFRSAGGVGSRMPSPLMFPGLPIARKR